MDEISLARAKAMQRVDKDLIDAGKRAHDKIMLHYLFGDYGDIKNKWVAVSLMDGSCDGELYDTKQQAVRHQIHEQQCAYICLRNVGPGGTHPEELAIFLQFQRDGYRAGFRMPDPDAKDGGKDLLMTTAQNDYYRSRIGRHYGR